MYDFSTIEECLINVNINEFFKKRNDNCVAVTLSSKLLVELLGNMVCHLLPDSENIFKKHVHEDREIKSMALLQGTVQKAITQFSSQTSVKVDLELGNDMKIHKVMMREEFEDVNKEVFEKCERLIIQCLQDAEVEAKNINDVIIGGGCWNIPKVKNLVTKICKLDELYRGMNPLVAALQGAAAGGDLFLDIDHPFGKLDKMAFLTIYEEYPNIYVNKFALFISKAK